jgi:hypothetical protein
MGKGFWDDAEVISVYTRAQAIADGVLVEIDADGIAKEAGFVVPVAVTRAVWTLIEPTEQERERWGQSVEGRLWDVLMMAHYAIKRKPGGADSTLLYDLNFQMRGRAGYRSGLRRQTLKLVSGPGDEGEHVITIMLPEED